jgi:hypothetical protein
MVCRLRRCVISLCVRRSGRRPRGCQGMVQEQSKAVVENKAIGELEESSSPEAASKKKTDERTEKLSERLASNFPAASGEPAKKAEQESTAKQPATSPARRGAGPASERVAANDDLPSIGGLIFALQQRPSRTPFYFAFGASVAWLFMCLGAALFLFNERLSGLSSGTEMLRDPAALTLGATMFVPMVLFWFLALLIWRAQELRLMASAMTEVAVRLAEPDKMAAQSVASLGQTIRRQVAAMNDAISRALGRAGELEALVHNEVAALERSYSENELRIRGLIDELASERDALANNSERVSETLRGVGAQVSRDIADVSDQATKSLAGATATITNNLNARGSKITEAIGAAGTAVDSKLAGRSSEITRQLVTQGDEVTKKLDAAGTNVSARLQEATNKVTSVVDAKSNQLMKSLSEIGNQLVKDIPGLLDRLDAEQKRLGSIISGANQNFTALENAIAQRTTQLDGTLRTRTEELKTTLANRIKAVDTTVLQHAKLIQDSMTRQTEAIETTVQKQAKSIESTVQQQSKAIETTVQQQAKSLESVLGRNIMTMNQVFAEGADALKKTTEHMTHQTGEASGNLSSQADVLKTVSNKLLEQVHGLTQRFETQGQAIMSASQTLDSSNAEINSILERRHAEIASLLDTVSTKAQALDKMMRSYSGIIEGSLMQVEERAKSVTTSLAQETAEQADKTVQEIERLRSDARQHTERAVAELTGGFHSIADEVANQLGTLTSRFGETTREMRQAAHSAADEIEGTRTELQRRIQDLPDATRHSQEAVRKAISDQLKALGTLSALSSGSATTNGAHAAQEDYQSQSLSPPSSAAPQGSYGSSQHSSGNDLASVTSNLASQLGAATGNQLPAPPSEQQRPTGLGVTMRPPSPPQQEEGWSVGDLLARASEPDRGSQPASRAPSQGYGQQGMGGADLRLNDIASAIDQQTASTVWHRFRRGERDIFSRQLYTHQGQATFDEISRRYQRDAAFRSTVDRYISDFERLLFDAERKGQNQQAINNYLTSETGRVYLMLAHASGRLR